jgi:hypothetical protein
VPFTRRALLNSAGSAMPRSGICNVMVIANIFLFLHPGSCGMFI